MVGRLAVVVELVREVGEALAPAPADRVALGLRQRLGDQHVVVDGDDVAPDRPHERRKRARRQQRGARPHGRAAGGRRAHAAGVARGERRYGRVLVDRAPAASARGRGPSTGAPGRRARSRRASRPRRGRSASRPGRAAHRRRAARRPSRGGAAPRPPRRAIRPGAARWRRRSCPCPPSRTRSRGAPPSHGSPRGSRAPSARVRHLAGPARQPVAEPVRERGGAEAAVAARRPEGDRLALEQDDVAALLDREERRPEAGQAAADDEQVGLGGTVGRRARRRGVRVVEPERARLRVLDQLRLAITCLICV